MPKDPRVDEYIAAAAPFARPILKHLRKVVHAACPGVEESIKWRVPAFSHNGQLLCGIAAFKSYATFGFWKAALLVEQGFPEADSGEALGHSGRLTSLTDLPPDARLTKMVRAAAALNEQGINLKRPKAAPKPPPKPPAYMLAALKKDKKAIAAWRAFSPSHQREYIEWITEAKTDATRDRRLAQAVLWMAEGKPRNWKYM